MAFPFALEPPGFDLDDGGFLGTLIGCLDYERRRHLFARGGSRGGSGRGRGPRRSRAGRASTGSRIRIPATIRRNASLAATRARRAQRRVELAKAEKERARRFYRQASETLRAVKGQERQALKDYREAERAAARDRRILAHFLTPAKSRTRYQRRVVSRETQRAELRSRRADVARLSDDEAISQAQRRLFAVFPNAANYDGSFDALDGMPEIARALLTATDANLRTLANDPVKGGTGVRFFKELTRLGLEANEIPSVNPLFYHSSSRTDYGI